MIGKANLAAAIWLVSLSLGQAQSSEGAGYVRELLEVYAENGTVIYDPTSQESKDFHCKQTLRHAERLLSRALAEFDYTVSLTIVGKSPEVAGLECGLSSERQVSIKYEGSDE